MTHLASPTPLVGLDGDPALGVVPYVDPPLVVAYGESPEGTRPFGPAQAPQHLFRIGAFAWDATPHRILRAWLAGPGGPRLEGPWKALVDRTFHISNPDDAYHLDDDLVLIRYGRSALLWAHGRVLPYAFVANNAFADDVRARLASYAPIWAATAQAPWWCLSQRPTGAWPQGGVLPVWSPAYPHWRVEDGARHQALLADIALAWRTAPGHRLILWSGYVGQRGQIHPPKAQILAPDQQHNVVLDSLDVAAALGGWDACMSSFLAEVARFFVPEHGTISAHAAMGVEGMRAEARARLTPFLTDKEGPAPWG